MVHITIKIGHRRSLDWRGLVISLLSASAGAALVLAAPDPSKSKFRSSEIAGKSSDIILADLDGDSLKDVILREGATLSVFYQEFQGGFAKVPQQTLQLEQAPAVVWPARLGKKAESLLILTSRGITELVFTNRTTPPERRQIITQPTIIPEALDEPSMAVFPLASETRTGWPLVLVPTAGGLQVWQQRQGWRLAQTLETTLDTRVRASVRNPGYVRRVDFDMGLADLDGDRRDDLMVRRNGPDGMQTYSAFLQKDNGTFGPDPALSCQAPPGQRTWLCWVDLNRDGKVDLIKSTLLEEPWFLPGSRSGKALVGIYYADERGRIPTEPQQVLRKNDSMSAMPVVDVDGDGFVDLALGSAPFDSRDGLRKMIMTRQASLNLKFHFYRTGGGFPKEPDGQAGVLIQVDKYSMYPGWSFREHFRWYVNLSGDFNGDGKKDLLVRERSDRLAVYFFVSRQKGFARDAGLRFDCREPIDWLEVGDLNGDGVCDVIVKFRKREVLLVFLSYTP